MAVPSDLVRWVNISLIKYFASVADTNSITLYVEGVDERSEMTMNANHAELRIQGPFIRNLSHNLWKVTCDVNIMLTVRMQMASQNAYLIKDWGGIFVEAMESAISVYKYGDGDALIDCLRVKLGRSDHIDFFDFGIVNNDTRIRQAEVDATFEMTTTLGE